MLTEAERVKKMIREADKAARRLKAAAARCADPDERAGLENAARTYRAIASAKRADVKAGRGSVPVTDAPQVPAHEPRNGQ